MDNNEDIDSRGPVNNGSKAVPSLPTENGEGSPHYATPNLWRTRRNPITVTFDNRPDTTVPEKYRQVDPGTDDGVDEAQNGGGK